MGLNVFAARTISRLLVFVISCHACVVASADIFTAPTVDDVPALVRSLKDSNVRQGASNALVSLGEPAVPQLIDSLHTDDLDMQIWLAYTLGRMGSHASAAAPTLAESLKSNDSNLCAVAARSLGQIGSGDAKVVDLLARSTTDDEVRVRRFSVVSLGQIGPAAEAALPQLVDALAVQKVRADAIRSLVRIGEAAVSPLTAALGNDNIRLDAAEALRQLDPAMAKQLGIDKPTAAALAALRNSLQNTERDIEARVVAAEWLGQLGIDAAPILISAFVDGDTAVVSASANAFRDIGASAVPLLQETLKHESARVRVAAVDALAAIGPGAEAAVPDLISELTDAERDVRHRAVDALDKIGPAAELAIPTLIAVMQNERDLEPTRQLAIKTLVRIAPPGHEDTIAALRESSKDDNFGVSSLAKEMLKVIETKSAQAP